jgi:WD40 repeat protein
MVPSATASPTATITPTPLPTFTPTLPPPAKVGTPLPEYLQPISFANASQVNALAEWQQGTVTDLDWSPDGNTLAVGGAAQVDFYDVRTRAKQKTLQVGSGLVNIDLSSNGRYLASGSNSGSEQHGYTGTVSFWRLSDDVKLFDFYLDRRGVSDLAFSPTGQTFAAAVTSKEYIDNSFIFWNTNTWEITRTMRTGGVLDMAFSPDGRFIASTPDRFAIRLWDIRYVQYLYELPTSFTGAVNSLVFSPDGHILATGHYDGYIRLWDVSKGELLKEFRTEGVVESLAFSPDGALLASGAGYRDFTIRLWDPVSGQSLQALIGHTHAVDNLAFSPDGHLLASSSYDGTLRLWGVAP